MLHGYIPANRFLPYLSWTDIDALEDKENTVIVLPVGAIEQHGPHMPCATDSIIAAGFVGKALELLPDNIPAYGLAPITYGKSDEHIHFPGTVTLTGELLLHTIQEIGESIYRAGFRKLLMINAHGGQPQPLEMAARELRLRHGDYMVISRSPWSLPFDSSFIPEKEKQLAMHAGHGGTAALMAPSPWPSLTSTNATRVCFVFSVFPLSGCQIVFYQDVDAETQFFDQPGTYELRAPAFFLNQVQGARGRACLNTCC